MGRWPKYVTRQRQRRVLERRLKVPSAVNQFRLTLDKQTKAELFKLLAKYKPETKKERAARRAADAEARKADKKAPLTARSAAPSWWRSRTTSTRWRSWCGCRRCARRRTCRTAREGQGGAGQVRRDEDDDVRGAGERERR